MDLTDPNFAFWETFWLKILQESFKISITFSFFFFIRLSQNIFSGAQHWEGDDYIARPYSKSTPQIHK